MELLTCRKLFTLKAIYSTSLKNKLVIFFITAVKLINYKNKFIENSNSVKRKWQYKEKKKTKEVKAKKGGKE